MPAKEDNLPNTANTTTATTHLQPGIHPLLCGNGWTPIVCPLVTGKVFEASLAWVSGSGVAVEEGTEEGAVDSEGVESD